MFQFKKQNQGFTLIELLIVIAIIAMLVSMGVVTFINIRNSSKAEKVRGDLNQIYKAMIMMTTDTGDWPGHQVDGEVNMTEDIEICESCVNNIASGFAGITQDDGADPYEYWGGPYMGIIPSDPWGNEYFFDTRYPYQGGWVATLGSYGKDRVGNLSVEDPTNDDNVLYILKQ